MPPGMFMRLFLSSKNTAVYSEYPGCLFAEWFFPIAVEVRADAVLTFDPEQKALAGAAGVSVLPSAGRRSQ